MNVQTKKRKQYREKDVRNERFPYDQVKDIPPRDRGERVPVDGHEAIRVAAEYLGLDKNNG